MKAGQATRFLVDGTGRMTLSPEQAIATYNRTAAAATTATVLSLDLWVD
jgi:hypothetical protein